MINVSPPTTRGYLLVCSNANVIQFLPWKKIEAFLSLEMFSTLSLEKREELKNKLYEQVIEYDPNTKCIWLSMVESKPGIISILYAIKNRPLTFEQMSAKYGIDQKKIETAYRYWEDAVTTEHQIGVRLGLPLKTVKELFALFEDTVPFTPELSS